MIERSPPIWMYWTRLDTERNTQLDPESFARLFEQARSTLRLVAAAECGFDLADDIVQHSAIIALQRLDQFTPGTNFTAWTATIVRGAARNQRRSEQRRRSRITRFGKQLPKQHPRRSSASTASELTSKPLGPGFELPLEFDAKLRTALDTLSTQQRTCLLLRTLLEHSYSEIGAILDMPEATARSHVHRARAALLDQLNTLSDPERSTP